MSPVRIPDDRSPNTSDEVDLKTYNRVLDRGKGFGHCHA